jgi:hypothetical protein
MERTGPPHRGAAVADRSSAAGAFRGCLMPTYARVGVLGLLGVVLSVSPGWAGLLTKAAQFACEAPASLESATATVKQTAAGVQVKFKARGLTPGASINCGYACYVGVNTVTTACGPADDEGHWSSTTTLPLIFGPCVGLVPVFFESGLPLCAPSVVP